MSTNYGPELRWICLRQRPCAQPDGVQPGGIRRVRPARRGPETWRKSHTKLAAPVARVSAWR